MDIKTLRARVMALSQTVNTSAIGSPNYLRYKPILESARAELERLECAPDTVDIEVLRERYIKCAGCSNFIIPGVGNLK